MITADNIVCCLVIICSSTTPFSFIKKPWFCPQIYFFLSQPHVSSESSFKSEKTALVWSKTVAPQLHCISKPPTKRLLPQVSDSVGLEGVREFSFLTAFQAVSITDLNQSPCKLLFRYRHMMQFWPIRNCKSARTNSGKVFSLFKRETGRRDFPF